MFIASHEEAEAKQIFWLKVDVQIQDKGALAIKPSSKKMSKIPHKHITVANNVPFAQTEMS